MKRDYATGEDSEAEVFVGFEVEKTVAYNLKTLFVAEKLPFEKILELAKEHHVQHIYLGANQGFSVELPFGKKEECDYWDEVIFGLLNEDYYVTLDYDVKYHEWVTEAGYNDEDKFISIISVKLPYIRQSNYHTYVKIDDKDFRATNEGVWVHLLTNLQGMMEFTPWSKYKDDEIITKDKGNDKSKNLSQKVKSTIKKRMGNI